MKELSELFKFVEQDFRVVFVILFACLAFTLFAALFDMWTALEVVRKGNRRPESRPLMKTGQKIMDYYRLIVFVFMVDLLGIFCFPFYQLPYAVVLITVGIMFREGLSMKENYELKNSAAAESMDIVSEIVKCLKKEDAEKLLKSINKRNVTNKHT